jgi:hypothetical protein
MDELIDYAGLECEGCGITSEQLVAQEDWTEKDIEECSRWMDWGGWYCHSDCLRDSR